MQSLPVRLFHAALSGLLIGFLLTLLFFHLQNRFHASIRKPQIAENRPPGFLPPPDAPADSPLDADNDGLTDAWELEHHHNPNDPGDSDADFDKDGLTALQEFAAGTDPAGKWKIVNIGLPTQIAGLVTYCDYSPTAPNSHGDFAVELYSYTSGDDALDEVYVYDLESAAWQVIPKPPGEWAWMGVADINDHKTVALYVQETMPDDGYHGFLWHPDGSFEELEDGEGSPAVADRINNHDEWIGWSSVSRAPVSSISGVVSSEQNSWTSWQYTDINDYGETMGVFSLPMQEPRTFLAYGNWFYPTGYPGQFPFFDSLSGVYNWPSAMNNWGEFVGSAQDVPFSSNLPFLFDGEYREITIDGAGWSPVGIDSHGRALTSIGLFSEGVGIRLSDLSPEISDGPSAFGISANSIILVPDYSGPAGISGFKLLMPDQDQDSDGMSDDWETVHGLNPINPSDALADTDNDGTNNYGEFLLRSNPNAAPVFDPNGNEIDVRPGIDTDGDKIPNLWEWHNGLDPNDASDAGKDYDRDGYSNLQEYRLNTDPRGASAYRVREIGPISANSTPLLSQASLGNGSLVNSAGSSVSESVFFPAHRAPEMSNLRRPALWTWNRADSTGVFDIYPPTGMAAGTTAASSSLVATADNGSALFVTTQSGAVPMYHYWAGSTSPAIALSGATSSHNVKSLTSARMSPGGNYLTAMRTSQSNAIQPIFWKMPTGTSAPVPIVLPLPVGSTLSSSATLHVNDHGHVAATTAQNRVILWSLNPDGASFSPSLLPLLPGTTTSTCAGISNTSPPFIAGNTTLSSQPRAIAWRGNASPADLGLMSGGTRATAVRISPSGLIAGWGTVKVGTLNRNQPFLASPSGSSWSLSPQNDPSSSSPTILAVTDLGEILGEFPQGTTKLATLWNRGIARRIQSLVPSTSAAEIVAVKTINNQGTILATSWLDGALQTVLITPDGDTDADGLPDAFENRNAFNAFVKNPPAADSDADGLPDIDEYRNGTNPRNPDTDGDGMKDGWEVSWGLLPLDSSDAALDPDNDRVTNFRESQIGTNPTGIYTLEPRLLAGSALDPQVSTVGEDGIMIVSPSFLTSYTSIDGLIHERRDYHVIPGGRARHLWDGWALPSSTVVRDASYSRYEEHDVLYWLEPQTNRISGRDEHFIWLMNGPTYFRTSLSGGLDNSADFSTMLDLISIGSGFRSSGLLGSSETVSQTASAVSSSGTRRIHSTSTGRRLILDEDGSFISELATNINWTAINNHGTAASLTSISVPASGSIPAYSAPILRISVGNQAIDHPLPHAPGVSPSFSLVQILDDGRVLLSRMVKNGQLINVKRHFLYDPASGNLKQVRQPGIGTEDIVSIAPNGRLLGKGNKPFQVTPDGTSIRLEALRVIPAGSSNPVPLATLLNPSTCTFQHITPGGRITFIPADKSIQQLAPHNDADNDGVPDDWELAHGLTDGSGDQDVDGLSDADEFASGGDPFLADTDGDGMPDGLEKAAGFNIADRDENRNGQSDGYEDFDGDSYTNFEEIVAKTDPRNVGSKPDGVTSAVYLVRGAYLEDMGTRAASKDKFPFFKEFPAGGKPEDESAEGEEEAADEVEKPAKPFPKYYRKQTVESLGELNINWALYQHYPPEPEYLGFGQDFKGSGNQTIISIISADGQPDVAASSDTGGGSWTFQSLPSDEDPETEQFSFPYNPPSGGLPSQILSVEPNPIESFLSSTQMKREVNWSKDIDEIDDFYAPEYFERFFEKDTKSLTENTTLEIEFTDSDLIASATEALTDESFTASSWRPTATAFFNWSETHEEVSLQDAKYKVRSGILPYNLRPDAKVLFVWKEVTTSQEGSNVVTVWKNAEVTPSGNHTASTDLYELSRPAEPGSIVAMVDSAPIEAPPFLGALNPGEAPLVETATTSSNGETITHRSPARGKPIRFRTNLSAQTSSPQTSSPRLTATGPAAAGLVLWEQSKNGSWQSHSFPYSLPAEQSAGPASEPGRYFIQAANTGSVELRIVAGAATLGIASVHVSRLDLDVDSDNSGEVNATVEEEKIEVDRREPGKILLDRASAESDENGIPLHPEKLAGLKLKTANLQPGEGITLNYPDKVLRIWKTPPGQLPTQVDLLSPNHSYTLSELGLSPGSTVEFSIQSLGTAVGLIRIGGACGESEDEILLNLNPVELAVDSNRNGEVEFGTDKTSFDEPYRFWINNDQDKGNDDEGDDIGPDSNEFSTVWTDCDDNIINDLRDLEDFARIQLKVPGMLLAQLKSGEIKLSLKFKDGTVVGDPAINIRPHHDPDGGRGYVEDEAEGLKHVGTPSQSVYNAYPWRITKEEGYVFESYFWDGSTIDDYPEATEAKPDRYLLFEGAGEGKGELVMELRKGNEVIGEGASCWLDLKDVKKFYEEYTMAGIYGKSWEEINQIAPTEDTDALSAAEKALYTSFELPEVFEYPLPVADASDYEKDYILFVHGWRMKPAEKYAFAETAFKRLWHRGYRGRFGTFSWPTEWTRREWPGLPGGILWDPRNYDRSDRKAYMSGTALNYLLQRLNGMYPGRVRMFAHSMGNVVASQALRIEAKKANAQQAVHTYAACQAASVAFAYDVINPRTIDNNYINEHPSVTAGVKIAAVESIEIPEVYGHFPYAFPETKEYFTGIDGVVAGNIANVHNWTDSALADWMVGQWQKPDGYSIYYLGLEYRVGWGYSDRIGDGISEPVWWRQDGITGWQQLSLLSDAPEVLAHIAEAKSPALGASVEEGGFSTQNVINQNLDTMTAFSEDQNFEGNAEDHSAQFRSINMRRWEFWDRLLRHEELFDVQTDYPEAQ